MLCNWNTAMAIMAESMAAEFAAIGVRQPRKSTKKLGKDLSMPVGWSEYGHFGQVDTKAVELARKSFAKNVSRRKRAVKSTGGL